MQQGLWHTIKHSLTFHFIFSVMVIMALYSAAHMVADTLALRGEAQDIESQRARLLHKKAELDSYLAELQTAEAIEREAKARFNLKKPGEEVVVVIPTKPPEAASSTEQGIWQRFKSYLGF